MRLYIASCPGRLLAKTSGGGGPGIGIRGSTWIHTWCRASKICGSANDYRFIVSHGLDRFVRYTGLDISAKNIANARRRFPDAKFIQASVLDIPAETGQYEYIFAHDLFEHLSPAAFEKAISEVLRVAKKEVWLSFFNMHDIPGHEFHDVGKYHLNRLSANRTVGLCLEHAANVEVVDVPRLVSSKFGYPAYYNSSARSIVIGV